MTVIQRGKFFELNQKTIGFLVYTTVVPIIQQEASKFMVFAVQKMSPKYENPLLMPKIYKEGI